MTKPLNDPASLLPLSEPVFQILLSLADGERHGYAIMQEVEAQTSGSIRLGPGTLYGAVKRLRAQGILEEVAEPPGEDGDERRRYYRLTPFGREVASLEAKRMKVLLDAAQRKQLLTRGSPA